MLRTFLAILLAHLLADFPLQTDAVVLGKRSRKLPYLEHGAIHWAVLIALLFFFSNTLLWSTAAQMLIAGYVVFHLAVDVSKNWLVERKIVRDSTGLFLLDQAFHVAAVVALTWFFTRFHWSDVNAAVGWSDALQLHVLMVAVVYAAVIFGGGYLVRYLTRSLTLQLSEAKEESTEELRNAGLYIGWLERFLVLTAVLVQSPAMIGLILTGKSIARLPELKGSRFAEYFLIGTLLSISFALLGGIVLLRLLVGAVSLK
jgi:Protein of unknown function (DUF3307)